ncbi:MAG: hypothetical protein MUE44_16225 [Oscillatoriaceae cyanobacterium Prado104]|jgi:hypothetical protein|nr:hypothetical protein [Oscillatoriaceae cyanobacterium Prado104]
MIESTEKRQVRRGRIFPDRRSTAEEVSDRIAQRTEQRKKCRQIFERICPQLMVNHYNWFIAIDSETGNYLLDAKFEGLMQQVKIYYPSNGKVRLTAFRLNEQGYCGLI